MQVCNEEYGKGEVDQALLDMAMALGEEKKWHDLERRHLRVGQLDLYVGRNNSQNKTCSVCHTPEDEEHFLLQCTQHNDVRGRTIDAWRRVYALMLEPFSLKPLLFPPMSFAWRHRKMILQAVARFAIDSGKFKRF